MTRCPSAQPTNYLLTYKLSGSAFIFGGSSPVCCSFLTASSSSSWFSGPSSPRSFFNVSSRTVLKSFPTLVSNSLCTSLLGSCVGLFFSMAQWFRHLYPLNQWAMGNRQGVPHLRSHRQTGVAHLNMQQACQLPIVNCKLPIGLVL